MSMPLLQSVAEKIGKLLKVCAKSQSHIPFSGAANDLTGLSGHLHFVTDAWTSPTIGPLLRGRFTSSMKVRCSHSCWTLSRCRSKYKSPHFLLLPVLLMIFESHTGVVLANTFKKCWSALDWRRRVKSFFFFISIKCLYYLFKP